mmetsp:Transcript_59233/g.152416  ORF Transcript_59233/g.152416 Transcript_59233/m.152416 type:complete len:211 (+) Transcript_59233:252-884(+)
MAPEATMQATRAPTARPRWAFPSWSRLHAELAWVSPARVRRLAPPRARRRRPGSAMMRSAGNSAAGKCCSSCPAMCASSGSQTLYGPSGGRMQPMLRVSMLKPNSVASSTTSRAQTSASLKPPPPPALSGLTLGRPKLVPPWWTARPETCRLSPCACASKERHSGRSAPNPRESPCRIPGSLGQATCMRSWPLGKSAAIFCNCASLSKGT